MRKRKNHCLWMITVLLSGLMISTGCEKNGIPGTPVPETPVIVTQTVTDIFSTGATLKATLKENDLPAVVTFEYGTSLSYGNNVTGVPDPVFQTGTTVMVKINSLARGTIYHFRVKAVNSAGTTFSSDMEFTPNFGIGEAFRGGFIIYLDNSGEHGLIAAENDQSEGVIWDNGTYCKKTGITSISIGSGKTNSARLVSILGPGSYPAKICDDLILNGYDDWFLPSLQELDCMRKGLSVFDRKYNLNGIFYWTSSESTESEGTQSCYAWVQSLLTGEQRTWPKNDNTPYVRAVRAF